MTAHERTVVPLRVKDTRQLFNSFDPSPFVERDLDANAAAYIVDWVRETRAPAQDVLVQVIVPENEAENAGLLNVREAIVNYFTARELSVKAEIAELFLIGWRYLAMGAVILFACLAASQWVRSWPSDGALKWALQESFIILGWVANWKPIETFLYDWQPLMRRQRLYRRLARADVEVVAA